MQLFLKNGAKALLAILFLLLLSNNYSIAQKGDGDFGFMAQTDMNSNGLYLFWFFDDGSEQPDQVEVWVQKGVFFSVSDMDDPELFTILTPSQWKAERGMFEAFVEHSFEKGYYTFYLSVAKDGAIRKSNTSPVSFYMDEPTRFLEFTTIPEEKAFVGQTYNSSVVAIDPEEETAEISYQLLAKPDGMVINESTGEITWTPQKKGVFEIWIMAYSNNNPDIYGEYYLYLFVFSCQNPAVLSGTITDSKYNPVTLGYIQLINEDFINKPDNPDQYYALVENGKYTVEADEGKYYLVFQDMYGYYEFYPGTFDFSKAELIQGEF